MIKEHYKLEYLPLFWSDLQEIVLYIRDTLKTPMAAQHFVEEVKQGILNHLSNPTIAAIYPSIYKREHDYYWFPIGNYMAFYVVIADVMEVRRCVYGKRNLKNIL